MVQIKNNLAAFGHSKAFRLTETGFEWIGDYEKRSRLDYGAAVYLLVFEDTLEDKKQ